MYTDGSFYEGTFVNGALTGKGIMTHTTGKTDSGDFIDGKFQGYKAMAATGFSFGSKGGGLNSPLNSNFGSRSGTPNSIGGGFTGGGGDVGFGTPNSIGGGFTGGGGDGAFGKSNSIGGGFTGGGNDGGFAPISPGGM
jgi:hypothetical protein